MEIAGIIFDDSEHFLDHLAPFCALMNWPLIICEPEIEELAKKFYPDLNVISKSVFELRLPKNLISCNSLTHIEAAFPFQKANVFWLPHGNSDKGKNSPLFEALQRETLTLCYGRKMIDFMAEKKVPVKKIMVGNFRKKYFENHAKFYRTVLSFPKGKNLLYAPTWDDYESQSSFWNVYPKLLKFLPEKMHLFVKLHPNTEKKHLLEVEKLKSKAPKNVTFLEKIPPIYPILDQMSLLFADTSSIAYDFLSFNRPMFFFSEEKKFPLHSCAKSGQIEDFDFSLHDSFSKERGELYEYTFETLDDPLQIKEEILKRCSD